MSSLCGWAYKAASKDVLAFLDNSLIPPDSIFKEIENFSVKKRIETNEGIECGSSYGGGHVRGR